MSSTSVVVASPIASTTCLVPSRASPDGVTRITYVASEASEVLQAARYWVRFASVFAAAQLLRDGGDSLQTGALTRARGWAYDMNMEGGEAEAIRRFGVF